MFNKKEVMKQIMDLNLAEYFIHTEKRHTKLLCYIITAM